MNDNDRHVLRKLIKYVREALAYTQGMMYDSFAGDSKTMSATAFVLGQIGELSKSISDDASSSLKLLICSGV